MKTLVSFLIVLLGVGDWGWGQCPLAFEAHYASSNSARHIALGDFDEDGNLDALVPHWNSGDVWLYRGHGNGTMSVGTRIVVGRAARIATVDDWNGDGHLDAAVTIYNSGEVVVLLGDGAGSFPGRAWYSIGPGPQGMAPGDFDEDGDLDLVAANHLGVGIDFLWNDGSGNFVVGAPIRVGNRPRWIEVGDLDEDGHADLVVTNWDDANFLVLLGDGRGSFTAGQPVTTGTNPVSSALADLDGDTHLDVVVANWGSDDVHVYLGDGLGGFSVCAGPFGVGTDPHSVRVGDLQGDGHLDLVVANQGSDDVSTLLGDGTGNFTGHATVRVGTSPNFAALGDLDGGGQLDAVVANRDSFNISVLRNRSPEIYAVETLAAVETGSVVVRGDRFDGSTTVEIDGAPAAILSATTTELRVAVGHTIPGTHSLRIMNAIGTLERPNGLPRWPTLTSEDPRTGGRLEVEIANGEEGAYALFVSPALLPNLLSTEPAIGYGIGLSRLDLVLSVGTFLALDPKAKLSFPLPYDPRHVGATLHLQAWARRGALPLDPSSFTNIASFTILP